MSIYTEEKYGTYKQLPDDEVGGLSLNAVAEYLGYNTDQVTTILGDFESNFQVKNVCVEIFTHNVVYVMADSTQGPLKKMKVDFFLSRHPIKDVFTSYEVNDILENGIKNETLTASYLAKVLNNKDIADNGIFYISSLGLYLIFSNGLLDDFQSADGLGIWAKNWKRINPQMLTDYEEDAKLYWGNNAKKILNEVNAQATGWASIPDANRNEFVPLHTSFKGLINYVMIQVCHYDKSMTFDEFDDINHGRYQEVVEEIDLGTKTYTLNLFTYVFDKEGTLLDFYPH